MSQLKLRAPLIRPKQFSRINANGADPYNRRGGLSVGWIIFIVFLVLLVITGLILLIVLLPSGQNPVELTPREFDTLCDKVIITTDRETGLKHVWAKNDYDAMFGMAWVNAEDRFLTVDYFRRWGTHSVAELFGDEDSVRWNAFMAGGGLNLDEDLYRWTGGEITDEYVKQYATEEDMKMSRAYVAGLNAWLDTQPLPVEYEQLGLTKSDIPPFEETYPLKTVYALVRWLEVTFSDVNFDCLVFFASGIGNYNDRRQFAAEYQTGWPYSTSGSTGDIGSGWVEKVAQCREGAKKKKINSIPKGHWTKTSDGDHPTFNMTLVSLAMDQFMKDMNERLEARNETLDEQDHKTAAFGSNVMVVSGEHTKSGKPIISNDPHLPGSYVNPFSRALGVHVEDDCERGPADSILDFTTYGNALGTNTKEVSAFITASTSDNFDWYLEPVYFDASGVPLYAEFTRDMTTVQRPIVCEDKSFQVNDLTGTLNPSSPETYCFAPHRNRGYYNTFFRPGSLPGYGVGFVTASTILPYHGFLGNVRDMIRVKSVHELISSLKSVSRLKDIQFSMADTHGNIAYMQANYDIPIREDMKLLGQADISTGFHGPWGLRDGSGAALHEWLPNPSGVHPAFGYPIDWIPVAVEDVPVIINPESGVITENNHMHVGEWTETYDPNTGDPGFVLPDGEMFYYDSPMTASVGERATVMRRKIQELIDGGVKITKEHLLQIQYTSESNAPRVVVAAMVNAYDRSQAGGADADLATAGSDPRLPTIMSYLRDWDGTFPTGIQIGYDYGDDPFNLPVPTQQEEDTSIAALVGWMGFTRFRRGLRDRCRSAAGLPFSGSSSEHATVTWLKDFTTYNGYMGNGAVDCLTTISDGATREDKRDILLLDELLEGYDRLASSQFPLFEGSTEITDYKWGRVHRVSHGDDNVGPCEEFPGTFGNQWPIHPLHCDFQLPRVPVKGDPNYFSDGLIGIPVQSTRGSPNVMSIGSFADDARPTSNDFEAAFQPAQHYVREMTCTNRIGSIDMHYSTQFGFSGIVNSTHYMDHIVHSLTGNLFKIKLAPSSSDFENFRAISVSTGGTDDCVASQLCTSCRRECPTCLQKEKSFTVDQTCGLLESVAEPCVELCE